MSDTPSLWDCHAYPTAAEMLCVDIDLQVSWLSEDTTKVRDNLRKLRNWIRDTGEILHRLSEENDRLRGVGKADDPPTDEELQRASVWYGSFKMFGVEVHCHTLLDGRRIVETDSMRSLLDAMIDGPESAEAECMTDETIAFMRWRQGI